VQDKVQINQDLVQSLTVTGHRGAAGLSPENTLESIAKALELNVDRVEVDVHQTKDDIIILMHDKKINRTTNGKGKIKDYTYAELMQFKIEGKLKIPTLEEALLKVKNKSVLLIEIKEGDNYYPGIEKRVLSLIAKHKASDWCIIQSFDDDILRKVHQLNPNIKLHKLLLSSIFYDLTDLEFVEEFSIYHVFASKRFINKVHALNKKVNVWTVNDKGKVQSLIEKGADGIITDYPGIVKN